MRLRFKRTCVSEQFTGIAYAIIGLIGFILAHFDNFILSILPRCAFKHLTGLPCPSCGATRAGILFSRMQIGDAFLENPLYAVLYTALLIYGMNSVFGAVFKKNVSFQLTTISKKAAPIFLITAIVCNWIYLIIRSRGL